MRNIGSAHTERVTATCGHEVYPYVPPHAYGRQPGPVGQRNIAKAQSEPCYSCQDAAEVEGQFIALVHYDNGEHGYFGPDTYLSVLNESKGNIAEDEKAEIVDLYVLPQDPDEYPSGDGDRAGEFFTYDRERDASILRYLTGNQVLREKQYPPRIAGASDTELPYPTPEAIAAMAGVESRTLGPLPNPVVSLRSIRFSQNGLRLQGTMRLSQPSVPPAKLSSTLRMPTKVRLARSQFVRGICGSSCKKSGRNSPIRNIKRAAPWNRKKTYCVAFCWTIFNALNGIPIRLGWGQQSILRSSRCKS